MSGTGSSNPRADPERDAWLREALRHAPDAQAEPPRALSEAIRREAHAAAAPSTRRPPARRVGRFAIFWAWLARPQAAAGFASLMVATLVGLLWWDRPMPAPTEPVPAAPMSQASARAAVVVAPAPKDETRNVATSAMPATALAEVRPARTELQRTAPAAPRTPPSPAPAQTRREDAAAERAVSDARAKAAFSPPPLITDTARPLAAREAPATQAAAAAPAAPAAADTLEAAAIRDQAARNVGQIARAAETRKADTVPASAAPGLGAWRASIAAEPQRWTWQRASGVAQPADAALAAVLARLDAATAGRWRALPDVVAPAGLTLYRDGAPVARWSLRTDPSDVVQRSNGSVLSADLDAADAAALAGMLATPVR
ncbi:MAG: hypothetical protein ABIO45_07505 [Burkholderiaceae bacterium]